MRDSCLSFGSVSLIFSLFQQRWRGQRLCLHFFVSLPPLLAFTAAVALILEPLADRHGGLFERAESIIEAD